MRDYKDEFEKRVEFIKSILRESGASGIVFGNSGGKDSALVGILCKAACENTVGIIMPCTSKRNYGQDTDDAKKVAEKYGIEMRTVDLTPVKEAEIAALGGAADLNAAALSNMAPRCRMITLYAVAASENRLVAGTGNKSEVYVGYFTKWATGRTISTPSSISPRPRFLNSCGIWTRRMHNRKGPVRGSVRWTDRRGGNGRDLYRAGRFISGGDIPDDKKALVERMHERSAHKRRRSAYTGRIKSTPAR
jgi:NAD+ synthase